jgi:D-3-phosphoglycerate dehydrogenase
MTSSERPTVPPIRLAYFDDWMGRWSNPEAAAILSSVPGLELVSLLSDAPDAAGEIGDAHFYQIMPRVELRGPWLADRRLIGLCPKLLAICTTGSGYDVVDVDACTDAGIIVCNQAGANKEAVAEHTLGMILCLSKKIALADKLMRRNADVDRLLLQGIDIRGKTVGIVGLGFIGTRVAELCGGLFEMKVLACDPYLSDEQVRARHAEKVDMDDLFRRADFVTVHCPRTAETMGMIGRRQFEAMKPTAYFVTTARGGVHDEDDLVAALVGGRIAGAGIDVFLEEPPPIDHPLLGFDNVVASPHIAGTTAESLQNMARANSLQWVEILEGRRPPRLLNPDAWPLYSRRFETLLGRRPVVLDVAEAGRAP